MSSRARALLQRRNVGVPPEGPAEHVANAIQILQSKQEMGEQLDDADMRSVIRRLKAALLVLREEQVRHPYRRENPATLAIVNPPGGKVMGDRVYEIAYRHVHDGEDYVHEFKKPDGVRLVILSPTQVMLDGGRMPIIDLFHV